MNVGRQVLTFINQKKQSVLTGHSLRLAFQRNNGIKIKMFNTMMNREHRTTDNTARHSHQFESGHRIHRHMSSEMLHQPKQGLLILLSHYWYQYHIKSYQLQKSLPLSLRDFFSSLLTQISIICSIYMKTLKRTKLVAIKIIFLSLLKKKE